MDNVLIRFAPVTTRCLRAVFEASSADGKHAGVAVQEWEALAPAAARVTPPARAAAPCAG